MAVLSTGRCRLHISSNLKRFTSIKPEKERLSGAGAATEMFTWTVPINTKKTESLLFLLFYFYTNPRGKDAFWSFIDSSNPFVGNISCRRYLSALEFTNN